MSGVPLKQTIHFTSCLHILRFYEAQMAAVSLCPFGFQGEAQVMLLFLFNPKRATVLLLKAHCYKVS